MELKELINNLKTKNTDSMEIFKVKGYIPLGEKIRIIGNSVEILHEIDNVLDDPRIMIAQKQMCKFFDLMLAYTNITVNAESRTPETYDDCMELMLDKYILSHGAKYDYARCEKMFDETTDLNAIRVLENSLKGVNDIQFKEGIEEFSKSLSDNNDALKAVANIFAINNPSMKVKRSKK